MYIYTLMQQNILIILWIMCTVGKAKTKLAFQFIAPPTRG